MAAIVAQVSGFSHTPVEGVALRRRTMAQAGAVLPKNYGALETQRKIRLQRPTIKR
jgi:hypothetical protein